MSVRDVDSDTKAQAFWAWFDGGESADAGGRGVPRPRVSYEVRDRTPLGYAITGSGRRRKPTTAKRREILALQKDRCLYCDHKFGSIVMRNGRGVVLHLNWDHFVPYAYGRTNAGANWVAACHVCNGIKSARMFDTVMEAQKYILGRWIEKGYVLRSLIARAEDQPL